MQRRRERIERPLPFQQQRAGTSEAREPCAWMSTVTLLVGSTCVLHLLASEPPGQKLSVIGVGAELHVATSKPTSLRPSP
jgi:hypothetical protein